jgi:hypothetical protein
MLQVKPMQAINDLKTDHHYSYIDYAEIITNSMDSKLLQFVAGRHVADK